MATTQDLLKIVNQIADLTPEERVRLGRLLVHEYSAEACDALDGIDEGFRDLERELGLV
jgi:hypothetical protein